jgi:hypothetical protein
MELTAAPVAPSRSSESRHRPFLDRLNHEWHERSLRIFMFVVLAHWAEHLVQAYQIYGLGWAPPQARGVLGLWYPWLVKSEVLHYGYALVMLIGLFILRSGFVGTARTWWNVALGIQFWHHIEHALLQGQVIVGTNLFHRPVPTSIAQLWIPRVELHLIYNTIVFIPMVVAMYYHLFPSPGDAAHMRCSCAVAPSPLPA